MCTEKFAPHRSRPIVLAMLRRALTLPFLSFTVIVAGCTGSRTNPSKDTSATTADTPLMAAPAPPTPVANDAAAPTSPNNPATSPRTALADYLRAHLPPGGRIVDEGTSQIRIVHSGNRTETHLTIAKAYLDLSLVYAIEDFANEIVGANKEIGQRLKAGSLRDATDVEIPTLINAPPRPADEARLPWPEDRAIRGIFLRRDGGQKFPGILDKLAARDMNGIVLDGKDYEGYITYPTKVALANEIGAAKHAPVRSLARAVQFAHAKGIRIIMRNSCFHDPWTAKQRPALSVQSKWGKPYPLQWVDPSNEEIQAYIVEIIKEQIEAGVDEIQLDYIRYPVQGIEGADFHLAERGLTPLTVIRDFVRRVKAVTAPRNVPLSLDVFGVVAWNRPVDVEPLGQDLTVLGGDADALSPMVYPSHFAKGFNGFDEPGNHPEVIGIGTKATVAILAKANLKTAVRPWLQAFPWRSPDYGPKYIAGEIKSAVAGGSTGWLLWHPGGDYGVAWAAIPVKASKTAP
jgi:hypothetical protein